MLPNKLKCILFADSVLLYICCVVVDYTFSQKSTKRVVLLLKGHYTYSLALTQLELFLRHISIVLSALIQKSSIDDSLQLLQMERKCERRPARYNRLHLIQQKDPFSPADPAGLNENLRYVVIDHHCQTKAGIHSGLSSIHYAND